MQTKLNLSVSKASFSQIDIIINNVIAMAFDSENIVLPYERITTAIKRVFNEPKYGFLIYCYIKDTGMVIGNLMVTLEYNYIHDRTVFWIQSVYTHPDYRKQGVFKANYQFVIDDAKVNNSYSVKLYVDKDNIHAEKAYIQVGMTKTIEEMWEIDPVFRNPKDISEASLYKWIGIDKLRLNKLTTMDQIKKIQQEKYRLVIGDRGTEINLKGLEKLLAPDAMSEVQIIEYTDEEGHSSVYAIIGLFYEFSDWRNNIFYYMYDIRINEKLPYEEIESFIAIIIQMLTKSLFSKDACGVRFMLKSEYPWIRDVLKNAGFEIPHYSVYEQVVQYFFTSTHQCLHIEVEIYI